MRETKVKFYCDCCNKEVDEWEYKKFIDLTITAYIPRENGVRGEGNSLDLEICRECAEEIGIKREELEIDPIRRRYKIKEIIKDTKNSIIELFKKFSPFDLRYKENNEVIKDEQ